MVDENAFGLLLSYYTLEADEYGLEREQFVARFEKFRNGLIECLEAVPVAHDVRAIDLGHAVYIEFAEGDELESPIQWLKTARARLAEKDFVTVAVLSHGSRWVDAERGPTFSSEMIGDVTFLSISKPSEPLRRALLADAASRPSEDEDSEGWGAGLYLDTEAVEALNKTPKNAPTVLQIGGATFYRAGS